MNFTHKRTWPEERDRHTWETDRTVFLDGKEIGRIYQVKAGPQSGKWNWFDNAGGVQASGVCETREGVLEALKVRYSVNG